MTLHDKYCVLVCEAKCCYTSAGKACENLTSENKCGIYDKWVHGSCGYQTKDIQTAPIMKAIEHGLLPKNVLDNCCYAHPELLEGLNNVSKRSN